MCGMVFTRVSVTRDVEGTAWPWHGRRPLETRVRHRVEDIVIAFTATRLYKSHSQALRHGRSVTGVISTSGPARPNHRTSKMDSMPDESSKRKYESNGSMTKCGLCGKECVNPGGLAMHETAYGHMSSSRLAYRSWNKSWKPVAERCEGATPWRRRDNKPEQSTASVLAALAELTAYKDSIDPAPALPPMSAPPPLKRAKSSTSSSSSGMTVDAKIKPLIDTLRELEELRDMVEVGGAGMPQAEAIDGESVAALIARVLERHSLAGGDWYCLGLDPVLPHSSAMVRKRFLALAKRIHPVRR